MGTPISKIRRKKKDEEALNRFKNGSTVSNNQNRTGLSNLPGTEPPPKFPSTKKDPTLDNSKLSKNLDENFKESDLNKLPRQKSASNELVMAIDDVNKKLKNQNNPNNSNQANSEVEDTDIDILVKEVERRANKQNELDKRIKENEKRLSDYYSKLSHDSFNRNEKKPNYEDEDDDDELEPIYSRISSLDNAVLAKKKKLRRELKELRDRENKKKLILLEQDRQLAVQKMKLGDALLICNSLNNFESLDSSSEISTIRRKNLNELTVPSRSKLNRKKCENNVDLYLESTDNLLDKNGTLLARNQSVKFVGRSVSNLCKNDEQEDLKSVYAKSLLRPDVLKKLRSKDCEFVQIINKCDDAKKEKYPINETELQQIISAIEQKETDSPQTQGAKYFYNGKEIQLNGSVTRRPGNELGNPKPNRPKSCLDLFMECLPPNNGLAEQPKKIDKAQPEVTPENQQAPTEREKTIVNKILDDLVLNYTMGHNETKNIKKLNNQGEDLNYKRTTELKKVEWDNEILDIDENIYSSLRRKKSILKNRSTDNSETDSGFSDHKNFEFVTLDKNDEEHFETEIKENRGFETGPGLIKNPLLKNQPEKKIENKNPGFCSRFRKSTTSKPKPKIPPAANSKEELIKVKPAEPIVKKKNRSLCPSTKKKPTFPPPVLPQQEDKSVSFKPTPEKKGLCHRKAKPSVAPKPNYPIDSFNNNENNTKTGFSSIDAKRPATKMQRARDQDRDFELVNYD